MLHLKKNHENFVPSWHITFVAGILKQSGYFQKFYCTGLRPGIYYLKSYNKKQLHVNRNVMPVRRGNDGRNQFCWI